MPDGQALPDGFRRMLADAFPPERSAAILAGCTGERVRAFRANLLRQPVDDLRRELEGVGIPFAAHALSPWSFTTDADGEYRLKGSAAYKEGRLYCQSLPSQLPALIPAIAPGDRVLDTCAAPGGKTSLLAMRGGRVTALERARVRFQKLVHNVRHLGCGSSASAYCVDARAPGPVIGAKPFAVIVCDPPCSGTGLLRTADPRTWEHLAADYDGYIASRARLQTEILSAATAMLARDGTLVYSTCAIDPRENEAVIDPLLRQGWRAEDLSSWRGRLHGAHSGLSAFRGDSFASGCAACLRLDPGAEGEGFFVACLRPPASAIRS